MPEPPAPGRRRSRLLSLLGIVVIVVMAAVYFRAIRDQLPDLREFDLLYVPHLLLLSVLQLFLAGGTNAVLLAMAGYRLSVVEIGGLSVLTTFLNYFGPLRAGTAIRASYLKKVKNTPFSTYAGILGTNLLFILLSAGLLCVPIGFRIHATSPGLLPGFLLLAAGLVGLPVAVFLLRPRISSPNNRLSRMLSLAFDSLHAVAGDRRGMSLVVLTVLAQYLCGTALIYCSYRAFGVHADVLSCLAIGVFQSISGFVTITPNNLGLQEFVMGYMGRITDLGFGQSLLVAGVIRVANVLVTFSLAPLSWYLLLRHRNLSWVEGPTPGLPETEVDEND